MVAASVVSAINLELGARVDDIDLKVGQLKLLFSEKCCDNFNKIYSPDNKLLGFYCQFHGWLPICSCAQCSKPVGNDRNNWANPHCVECMPDRVKKTPAVPG